MGRHTQNTALVLLLAFAWQCTKEVDEFIPDSTELNFMEEFAPEDNMQEFVLDGSDHAFFYTASGTQFEIDFGIYEFTDGSSCDCGEVKVSVAEFKKPSDFILANMPSGSAQKLLGVESMFYVHAESMGKALRLKDGLKMHFHEPADEAPENELYYGLGSVDRPEWKLVDALSEYFGHIEYSIWDDGSFKGYEAYIDRMGWMGIAKPLSPGTSVCVDLDLLTYEKNAKVFAVGQNELVVQPFDFDFDKECFCTYDLPIGLEIDLVVIRKSAEDAYNFVRHAEKVSPELEVHLTYDSQLLTNDQVIEQIRKLD